MALIPENMHITSGATILGMEAGALDALALFSQSAITHNPAAALASMAPMSPTALPSKGASNFLS